MSAVIAVPELMTSAATDLATITSNLNAAHLMAAPPTLAVPPAAADEVSTGVAHLFSRYAEDYQRLAGKAADFQEQFAQHLTAGAGAYAGAEASAASLQPLSDIAGSVDAVGALPGQAAALFNTVGSQLLNTVATLRGALVTTLTPVLAVLAIVAIIAIIVAAVLIVQLLNGAGFTYLLGLIGL
jgi:PE family